MKRIGIDARLYSQTGVGVYLRNLLENLQKMNTDGFEFYIYLMEKESRTITFSKKTFIKRPVNFHWHSFSEQIGFLSVLNNDQLDLMHFTYFSYPVFYRKPFIATVHDLTPLKFRTGKVSTRNKLFFSLKHLAFTYVLKNQVQKAESIIVPTHFVKNELVSVYGKKIEKKIHTLYEGVNYELLRQREEPIKDLIKQQFFIYIGNFYPHKNIERLISAYAKINTSVQLILVGPRDFFAKRIQRHIQAAHAETKIKVFHSTTLGELIYCYRHAIALIHPSLSEGFGLPITEAMYYKLPIIASHIDVFKELLGSQYISFNPTDEDSIKETIEMYLKKPVTFDYDHLLKKYSFSTMTKHTFDLYTKILVSYEKK